MFKFLKDKIKKAVSSFSKKAEEEVVEEKVEDKEVIEEAKIEEEELLEVEEEVVEEIKPNIEEIRIHEEEKKKQEELKLKKKEQKKQEEIKEKEIKKEELKDFKEYDKTDEEIEEVFEESHSVKVKEKEVKKEKEKPIEEEIVPEEKVEDKKVIEEAKEEEEEKIEEEVVEKPEKKIEKEKEIEKKVEETPVKEKKGFFGKLKESFTKKTLSKEKFDDLFWDLEVSLLENNVAVEVIEKIKEDLKNALTSGKVSRLGINELIRLSLKKSISELFEVPGFDLIERIKKEKKRPFVIAFIGVNGSGKTTTLAKIANLFLNNDLKVVLAASDTFRAAAIDQLEEHAHNLGVKMISQGYNADPAAVAFDAIEHAKSKGIDIVMIDTAGRLHSNTNLMVELEKVIRVSKPDLKIFIGESITGNDCVEQAKQFDEKVGIDAIILSKADVDEKGGAAISVSYVTGKPILYLGVGQNYGDLKKFDKHKIIKSMGL